MKQKYVVTWKESIIYNMIDIVEAESKEKARKLVKSLIIQGCMDESKGTEFDKIIHNSITIKRSV